MRLLYLNKIRSNVGWGAETFLDQAFHQIGVETYCIDYLQNEYELATLFDHLTQDFDAVLLQRGTGYSIPLSVLRAIRRPRFLFFTELVARHARQHYLLRSSIFSHIFLRSEACIDHFVRQNWQNREDVSLIRSAIEPALHRPLPHIEKDIDVLFLGSLTSRRERLLAEIRSELPITIASGFGEEMVTLINRAKIILNLHADDALDTETRVYETLACQGFLISERLSSESPFTHGKHLVEVSNTDQMKQQVRYYLAHPDQCAQIATTGYRTTVSNHTYIEQAKTLVATIGRYLPRQPTTGPMIDRWILHQGWFQERADCVARPMRGALYRLRKYLLTRGRGRANRGP